MRRIIIALTAFTCLPAWSAMVDYGTYFQDTDSGLYWLKLTETNGRSYDDVSDKFGFQEEFEGWRYATAAETEALIAASGVPAQGTECASSFAYCDRVDSAYAEQLEALILLLGDTYDIWLDENADDKDVAATGAGKAQGMLGAPYQFTTATKKMTYVMIQDGEWTDRATQSTLNDRPDGIYIYSGSSGITTTSAPSSSIGSLLVRDTDPTIPLPDPGPQPDIEIVFDNLAPEEINLTAYCDFPFSTCSYNEDSFSSFGGSGDGGGVYYPDDFGLYVTADYDAQARPWVRMISYGATVIADPEYEFLPPLVRDVIEFDDDLYNAQGLIQSTYVPADQLADLDGCYLGYCGYVMDDVKLEFISDNIVAVVNPWTTSKDIRPKAAYFFTVGIKTLSKASGDNQDFDAATVDPATLSVGPNMAPNVATPMYMDIDEDGDIDAVFGFRMEATGISCIANTLAIAGRTFNGDPIHGQDGIVTIECEETVDIDVDPFNAANEVRPDDDYQLTVGVLGMNTADGDPVDLDASQVDPASLRFGPAQTPNVLSPIISDLDGDATADLLVGFSMLDSGILCGDTELEMTGELYSGLPIEAVDSITTTDCEASGCHP